MKRKSLGVLSLLLGASMMAAVGTGAIDVFSAKRSSDMQVVTDAEAIVAISSQSGYTKVDKYGSLELDFTDGNSKFDGKGFNPRAKSEFNDVFTVTNQSADTVYVWLEAEGWSSQHNAGLEYRIEETDGEITNVNAWYGKTQPEGNNLLDSTGMNFVDGKGNEAYVKLDAGESMDVKVLVNTVLENGYGSAGSNWNHKVIVKANENAPVR